MALDFMSSSGGTWLVIWISGLVHSEAHSVRLAWRHDEPWANWQTGSCNPAAAMPVALLSLPGGFSSSLSSFFIHRYWKVFSGCTATSIELYRRYD